MLAVAQGHVVDSPSIVERGGLEPTTERAQLLGDRGRVLVGRRAPPAVLAGVEDLSTAATRCAQQGATGCVLQHVARVEQASLELSKSHVDVAPRSPQRSWRNRPE